MPETCSVYKLGDVEEPEEREGSQGGGKSLSPHPAPLLALSKGVVTGHHDHLAGRRKEKRKAALRLFSPFIPSPKSSN